MACMLQDAVYAACACWHCFASLLCLLDSQLVDEHRKDILSMENVCVEALHVAAFLQVLDAPALADDFYLNLVDWSAQNLLAVGLDSCVYLWSAHTSKVGGGNDEWRTRQAGSHARVLVLVGCCCFFLVSQQTHMSMTQHSTTLCSRAAALPV
jgi:hypothetical protein